MEKCSYKIALVQAALDGSREANTNKCMDRIRQAARDGAQIVCLPELYSSFYFCQSENSDYFDLAEPLHGPSFQVFSRLAQELRVAVIVPFFERRAAGIYHNSAVTIDADGTEAGLYRKMHIPDDPSYYEKFYFTPGDTGFRACDTAFGRIATMICWDQWYPEGARIWRFTGRRSFSIRPRSAGTPVKRPATGRGSTRLGNWSSAATRWPTASMSRLSIGWVLRNR